MNMQMKALQIRGEKDLVQTQLPVPTPQPGEVLIKTAYVGICGTDIHLWQGRSFYYDHGFLKYPFVFGHEYTGTIVDANGIDGVNVGDRVVGHCMVECHVCDNCRKGKRHLCRNLKEVGLRYIPGAASEYLCVPAYAVTKIPDDLSMLAATLVEPSVTAYHAVERANIRTDDVVAVIGTGTLGLLALLIAKLTAARVDVIGVAESELAFAKSIGATNTLRPDEVKDNSYSVVLEASGAASALGLTARILDLGGRCSMIGVINQPAKEFIPSLVTLKDHTFHGILHGLDYYQQTVELFASKRVDPTVLIGKLGKVEDAAALFEQQLEPNRTKPKYVIEFAGEPA